MPWVGSGLLVAGYARFVRRSPYFEHGRGTDGDAIELALDRVPV
jgi:hypothetical protein